MPVIKSGSPKKRASSLETRLLRTLAVVVAVLVAMVAWQELGRQATASRIADAGRIGVTSVHDGDTFRIGAERIRVLGMDAPEIGKGANCPAEQRAAERARDYLRMAVTGNNVTLERDGLDVYGRTLARVYVEGIDVAPTMIDKDLAKPYVRGEHGDWC